jgi:hypothetical protein
VHVKPLIIAASGDTYLVTVSREDQRRQPETLAVTYYEKVVGVLGGEAQTKDINGGLRACTWYGYWSGLLFVLHETQRASTLGVGWPVGETLVGNNNREMVTVVF